MERMGNERANGFWEKNLPECETDEIGFTNRGEVYQTKVREENVL